MLHSISCIIPFYNEADRILKTLDIISTSNYITEIIAIDDGSKNPLKIPHKNIKLLQHDKNKGKSAAIQTGLKNANTEYILLIDADTSELNVKEMDEGICQFFTNNLDLLIFRSRNAFWSARFFRHDILFSGHRILSATDLQNVFDEYHPQRYQIETAINLYMMKHHKNVRFTEHHGFDPFKSSKVGYWRALVQDLTMMKSIFFFKGLPAYFKQVFFFAWNKLND